jgi:ElaB/YqjD/DUF883 family membrane-anchored ribosome-binding protein
MATAASNQTTSPSQSGAANSLRNALGNNQMANKATKFAKERPWATAALAGVVGMALLNTLRGKGLSRSR